MSAANQPPAASRRSAAELSEPRRPGEASDAVGKDAVGKDAVGKTVERPAREVR